jgi:G6PDH family F420-dependent oxidoreductase
VALAARLGDELVCTDPDAEAVAAFREARRSHAPATCQVPVSYGTDRRAAVQNAHRMFRWSALGWPVMSELPNPVNFDAASRHVTPDDVAERIPCGDDPDAVVEAVRPYAEAGFDRVALVQIGPDQEGFLRFWDRTLRDRLDAAFGRELAGTASGGR